MNSLPWCCLCGAPHRDLCVCVDPTVPRYALPGPSCIRCGGIGGHFAYCADDAWERHIGIQFGVTDAPAS